MIPAPHGERADEPEEERDTVLDDDQRLLLRIFFRELEKKLGATFTELKMRNEVLAEVLPTMKVMHDTYKWKSELYRWWLGMVGKFIITVLTATVGIALLVGAVPAIRLMATRLLTP